MKKILKYCSILLVIIWMILVFSFSKESGKDSKNTSSNFIKTIFIDNITNEKVEKLTFITRKMAHFSLYMLGGMCICLCVTINFENIKYNYLISYFIGTTYALIDELHQYFVPGRSCEFRDIVIDSIGVLVGVEIIRGIRYLKFKYTFFQ